MKQLNVSINSLYILLVSVVMLACESQVIKPEGEKTSTEVDHPKVQFEYDLELDKTLVEFNDASSMVIDSCIMASNRIGLSLLQEEGTSTEYLSEGRYLLNLLDRKPNQLSIVSEDRLKGLTISQNVNAVVGYPSLYLEASFIQSSGETTPVRFSYNGNYEINESLKYDDFKLVEDHLLLILSIPSKQWLSVLNPQSLKSAALNKDGTIVISATENQELYVEMIKSLQFFDAYKLAVELK